MINQVTLVGRLVRKPELDLTETGKKIGRITLAVPREYKNTNGEYETDFLDCILWSTVADTTAEYCNTGDILGLRGKIQSRYFEQEDGTKTKKIEIVADRISFLSSKSPKDKNIEELDSINLDNEVDNTSIYENNDSNVENAGINEDNDSKVDEKKEKKKGK